jgi:hypothetical protein
VSKALAIASSGDMEWVDPFVGARIRHQLAPGKEVMLEGDVGGFGVGSDFSWQLVGTYGFDTSLFGTPFHAVVGYRALSVDFSENGRFGKNGITSWSMGRSWAQRSAGRLSFTANALRHGQLQRDRTLCIL